jgi:hypothetical protein
MLGAKGALMPSPRNAPRRDVITITKMGRYGHVVWAHQLICGHTLVRKRKSPTGIVGCVKCIDAEEFEELSEALALPQESPIDDGLSDAEAKAMKYKAILAGRFSIPSEQIDVGVRTGPDGMMRVDSATVFLTGRQLRALD